MNKDEFVASTPDVLITIGGLALCCYNRDTESWQVIFPEDEDHQLSIKVIRYEKSGGAGVDNFVVEKGAFGKGAGRRISLLTNGTNWIQSGAKAHFEGDKFSWVNYKDNDEKDFRYVINLEDKYMTHKKVEKVANENVLLLTLKHTFLFTLTPSSDAYLLFDEKGYDPTSKFLHKVGKIIGGNIFVNPLVTDAYVKLEIEDYQDPEPMNNFEKYRYEIHLDNDCPSKVAAEKDETLPGCDADFPTYYELVTPSDSNDRCRFSLKKIVSIKDDTEILGRTDCDGAWLSETTNLF